MTLVELNKLTYFQMGEKDYVGNIVNWDDYLFKTMCYVDVLRLQVARPIALIRGAHPNRPEAVDATSQAPLSRVTMELMRFSGVCWGVYTGNSFHIDTRALESNQIGARWMAIRKDEREFFEQAGFGDLIKTEADNWLYLTWSHDKALDALQLVCSIAEGRIKIPKIEGVNQ